MATIFISHSRLDKELVYHYTTELRKHKHEVLIDDSLISPGKELAQVLIEGQKIADGTLVFLTKNSVQSVHVLSELGIAKAYEQNGKFFILLVKGEVSKPYILEGTQYIRIDEENIPDTVEHIENFIRDFLSRKRNQGDDIPLRMGSTGERVKEVQNLLTQIGPFKVIADGAYGSVTYKAVTAFQKNNHLAETGAVDQATYEALVSFSTIKKEEKTETPQINYWLLKINEKNWKKLKLGLEANFSTHTLQGDQRPGYENFEKVRKGDQLLGYAYFEEKAIVCIFLVTGELHTHQKYGEVIDLEVTEVLGNKIPLSAFAGEAPPLQAWVQEGANKLFLLSAETFNKIRSLTPYAEAKRIYQEFSQTDFSTDSVDGKLVDQLNVAVDVMALASVITYAKVKPPLAIGLFGTW